MPNKWKVAIIGECMVELHREDMHLVQTYGGDTFNTAAYLSRICGKDIEADYMSAVGKGDSFSRGMLDFWHVNGVKSNLAQKISGKLPGLYAIEVDEKGERSFLYWRSEAAVRGCFQTPESSSLLERLSDFDLIYLSGISLAVLYQESRERLLEKLEDLSEKGVAIAFDFNYRPHLWGNDPINSSGWYRRVSRICRWIFLSPEELPAAGYPLLDPLSDQFRQIVRELGSFETIVKNGDKPCTVFSDKGNEMFVLDVPEKLLPVDTTAAGDSFTAAYLAAARYGLSIEERIRKAQKLASAVIMHPGAIIPEADTPDIFSEFHGK